MRDFNHLHSFSYHNQYKNCEYRVTAISTQAVVISCSMLMLMAFFLKPVLIVWNRLLSEGNHDNIRNHCPSTPCPLPWYSQFPPFGKTKDMYRPVVAWNSDSTNICSSICFALCPYSHMKPSQFSVLEKQKN